MVLIEKPRPRPGLEFPNGVAVSNRLYGDYGEWAVNADSKRKPPPQLEHPDRGFQERAALGGLTKDLWAFLDEGVS